MWCGDDGDGGDLWRLDEAELLLVSTMSVGFVLAYTPRLTTLALALFALSYLGSLSLALFSLSLHHTDADSVRSRREREEGKKERRVGSSGEIKTRN